jgi:hypothetical protein
MSATIIDFRRPPLIAAEEKKQIATLLGQIMRAICDEKLEDAEEDAEELVHRLICIRALGKGGDGRARKSPTCPSPSTSPTWPPLSKSSTV